MRYEGNIRKMRSELDNSVDYYLPIGTDEIHMNKLIGRNIKISYSGIINCVSCSAKTKTSFHQGHCYSCFTSLPQCDVGILRPEQDMSHEGISRDLEWAKKNSLVDHAVYIAITGGVKVGVTRFTQIPTRWIDQGAIKAIVLAKTPHRNLAGQIEVFLKDYIADKTNWSKMLKTKVADINLVEIKNELSSKLPEDLKMYLSFNNKITKVNYPDKYEIDKFSSKSLDKENIVEGKLVGIKGQYLIFESGNVINIRKHNGYFVSLETTE